MAPKGVGNHQSMSHPNPTGKASSAVLCTGVSSMSPAWLGRYVQGVSFSAFSRSELVTQLSAVVTLAPLADQERITASALCRQGELQCCDQKIAVSHGLLRHAGRNICN